MMLTLYANRESGHCYKIALFLALTDTPCRYVAVDLAQPRAERPEEFRAISKFGEVPVLVTEEGEPLCQSNAILNHLAWSTGRFGGTDVAGWRRIHEWLSWETNRIGFSLPNLRFERRFALDPDPAVGAWLVARLRGDLDRLETELGEGHRFLIGDELTIADLACCAYLYWSDQAGLGLAPWPAIERWLERIAATPGWAAPYDLLQ
jgi:glutathione S-transferase